MADEEEDQPEEIEFLESIFPHPVNRKETFDAGLDAPSEVLEPEDEDQEG